MFFQGWIHQTWAWYHCHLQMRFNKSECAITGSGANESQIPTILPVQIMNVCMAQDHMPEEEQKRSPHQDQQMPQDPAKEQYQCLGGHYTLQQG